MNVKRAVGWMLVLVALAMFMGFATAAPVGEARSQTPAAIPGGVADPDGKTGYVVNAKGELDAIDLKTGKVRWTATGRYWPMVASDNQLICATPGKEANAARLVVFDNAAKGKQVLESEPVAFPDWVNLGPSGLGYTFAHRAALDGGDLLYGWNARSFYFGGVPLPPEELKKREKQAAGVARIKLDSGKVEKLDPEKIAWPSSAPAIKDLAKPEELPFTPNDQWMTAPQVVGENVVRVAWGDSKDGKERQIYLLSWEAKTGKFAEAKLVRKAGPIQWPTLTLDGRHFWIQLTDEKSLPSGRAIFDLSTGMEIGKLPKPGPGGQAHEVAVIGGAALYVEQTQDFKGATFTTRKVLTARSLSEDKQLWTKELQAHVEHAPPP